MNLENLKEYIDSELADGKTVTVKTSDGLAIALDSNQSSYSLNIDHVLAGFVGFDSNSKDDNESYWLVKTDSIISIHSEKFVKEYEGPIADVFG